MTLDEDAAVADASALAVTLRGRLAALYDRTPTADTWLQIATDALAGITALAAAVPALRGVAHWTDDEARNPEARPEVRAIAAVRSLDVRVRRATGRRVIALHRP